MYKQAAFSFGLVLLALLVAPVVFAADGPPNLGTAAVAGEDGPNRWYIDARIFENGAGQSDFANTTYSLGFTTPINDNMDLWAGYSWMNASGPNAINGAVRASERDVLTAAVKCRISSKTSNPTISVTGGLDVGTNSGLGTNTATGFYAKQDPIIPAAKLQIEWGKPGGTQFQIAGQIAWWDDTVPATNGDIIANYGTVSAVGAGLVWPISRRLALSGDAMFIVGGENAVTAANLLDDEMVWSAGGSYAFKDRSNTVLSAYATNSMSPTVSGSIIAASEDSVALGLSLRRDL